MVLCLCSKLNLVGGGDSFDKTIIMDSKEQKYSVNFVCNMLRKLKLISNI